MKDNFRKIELMKGKGIKLIAALLALALAFTMAQGAANAETLGLVGSLVSSYSNDAEQTDSAQIGSGEILQPKKTEVRLEDTVNDKTPEMMLGWDKTHIKKGDRIYIGRWDEHPISWSVINPKGINSTTAQGTHDKEKVSVKGQDGKPVKEEDAVFLMASNPLPNKTIVFYDGPRWYDAITKKTYYDSNLRAFLNDLLQFFSPNERMSVLKTDKKDAPYKITGGDPYKDPENGMITLDGDSCFPASVNEIDTYDCGIYNGDYWLRSAIDYYNYPYDSCMGVMNGNNQHTYANVTDKLLVRPAMNFNSSNVLLTTAFPCGKPSADQGKMFKVGESTASEYKLTLPDHSRDNFIVLNTGIIDFPGREVSFNYTGAISGDKDYISAIITAKDKPNDVLYYGKLDRASTKGEGTVTMKIPEDLRGQNYVVKIFNEQCKDDGTSDYSSPLREVPMTLRHSYMFYDNGSATSGDTPQDKNSYDYGNEATVLDQGNLEKKVGDIYYTFNGWSDGTKTYKPGDKIIIGRSNVTLTAQWKECKTVMMGAQLQYGSYVYMGNYNKEEIKWRVLNANGANITYCDSDEGVMKQEDLSLKDNSGNEVSKYDAAFLMADDVLINENKDFGGNQKYATSSMRSWANDEFLIKGISSLERCDILQTTKTDEAYIANSIKFTNQDGTPMNNILNDDRAFLLSAKEANTYLNASQRISKSWWWLRSPVSTSDIRVGYVDKDGSVLSKFMSEITHDAYPAINFNRNSVIFTSDKIGGKPESIGSAMSPVTSGETNEYRFTLKDDSRDDFSVSTPSISGHAGETVILNYSNANIGGQEYISAIIMKNDGSNDIICYGKLTNSLGSGIADMLIPENLDSGTYTVKIFNELQNNTSNVDYSSPLRDVELTVTNTP